METIISQLKKTVEQALAAGWSINRIAKEAGVSRPSLQEWIHGEQESISFQTAAGLISFFGMRLTKPKIPKPE